MFPFLHLLYLQRVGLRAIGDEIAAVTYPARLAVHRATAATPYVQKKGKGSLDIRPVAFVTDGMDDDAGKACCFQGKVTPAQAVVESAGDLALKPAEVWKFMQDHT